MTKNFKSYVLSALAVAAIALSGCSKSDEGMTPAQKKDFSVVLTGVSTKTTNDGMATLWKANDAINLFHSQAGISEPTYENDGKFSTTQSAATATFTGDLATTFDETKTYNWYAFYPYTSQITTPANTSAGYTYVGSRSDRAQTQTGNNSTAHIAGTNYPIAGVLEKVAGTEKPVIQMRHLSSLVAVKVTNGLKSDPITVSKVSITADGEDIVGSYYIDFTNPYNPSFTPSNTSYVSNTANLDVTGGEAIAAGESATFYLAVKPFTVNEGDDFTVTVTATNGPDEKVITADKNYTFAAGKVKTVNFTYDATVASYDFTTVAELNALATATSDNKFGKLTNAVVSFVPTTGVAIITDGTASITYYKSSHGLKQGQTYTGDISVAVINYNSLYTEITSMDATFVGDGAVVEPESLTPTQLNGKYTDYQNTYAKFTDVEVTAVSGKNVTVTDGTNSYVVFTNYANATCVVGDKITAIGTITKYGTTEELKVWKADDFTVTSHTAGSHAINFTQPEAGGTIKVSVDGSEITSGTKVMEGKTVKVEIVLTGTHNFTNWNITGAVNLSSTTSHVVTFEVGTEDVTIVANLVSTSVSTYTLDGAAIKAAHSTAWNYTSGTNTITATDGSVWTSVNTYGNKDQISIQMNSGKGCYLLTPDVGTKKIKKLIIDLNSKADGTGTAGTRKLIISKADGTEPATVEAATLIAGYTPTVSVSQLRIEPSSDGAVYLMSVTIQFE